MTVERVFEVESSFEAADQSDRAFWWAQSAADRLSHVLWLRKLWHRSGFRATSPSS